MNTLAQYQLAATDEMLAGVLDTIVKESPVLARMPFRNHIGKAFLFNIESSLAGVGWYVTNDTITESANVWAQGTVSLATMGGDVDTDIYASKTMGNVNDLVTINVTAKAKAMAHEFDRAFIYGQTTTTPDAKEMKGILKWIANYETSALTTADLDGLNNDQVIPNDATHAALVQKYLDQTIDAVRPKPDCLLMNRFIRRYLSTMAGTASTSPMRVMQDEFGKFITVYNEIPVLINDFILSTHLDNATSVLAIASINPASTYGSTSSGSVGDNSVVLALRFGEMDGVCGIQNGPMEHYPIGELESKRAYRNRFMWDLATVMLGKKCAAVLIGCSDES